MLHLLAPLCATSSSLMLPFPTTTIVFTTMNLDPSQNDRAEAIRQGEYSSNESHSSNFVDNAFNDSKCLFCNQVNTDLNQNITHMSKVHGLHIDLTDLLVDVASLLSYMHLLIFDCHECIYCGTQRHTRQAVQQHMIAKGHCKYELADGRSELQDFFEQESSESDEEHRKRFASRSDDHQLLSKARSRKARSRNHGGDASAGLGVPTPEVLQSRPRVETNSDSDGTAPQPSNALSNRVLKQEQNLNNQLSRLRTGDRQSLAHLPASQQRSLLATRHKQMEQGRRSEQSYHSHLESAGNKFGRLSTVRLIRKPPHMGHVSSLNR